MSRIEPDCFFSASRSTTSSSKSCEQTQPFLSQRAAQHTNGAARDSAHLLKLLFRWRLFRSLAVFDTIVVDDWRLQWQTRVPLRTEALQVDYTHLQCATLNNQTDSELSLTHLECSLSHVTNQSLFLLADGLRRKTDDALSDSAWMAGQLHTPTPREQYATAARTVAEPRPCCRP